METRASYTLVGAFVLALAAALFIFVVWLAKIQLDGAVQRYYIFFTGTVTGLVEGSPVRYRGVSVGTVSDIRIDPDNVERVRVTVEVPEGTPIKTDALASLEPVGVTGGVYVEIAGGSQEAPLLEEVSEGIPVIPSRPSSIAEVLEQAPKLLQNLIVISERLTQFMSAENQQAFTTILGNLAGAAGHANATMHNADQLMAELRREVNAVGKDARTLLGTVNGTVARVGDDAGVIFTELAATSKDLRQLTASLAATSGQLAAMIEENREPIRDFTGEGLYELRGLMTELQALSASLSRVTRRLERDPSDFLFGNNRRGVEVE